MFHSLKCLFCPKILKHSTQGGTTHRRVWQRNCWRTPGCPHCNWGGRVSPSHSGWCYTAGQQTWRRCAPALQSAWTVHLHQRKITHIHILIVHLFISHDRWGQCPKTVQITGSVNVLSLTKQRAVDSVTLFFNICANAFAECAHNIWSLWEVNLAAKIRQIGPTKLVRNVSYLEMCMKSENYICQYLPMLIWFGNPANESPKEDNKSSPVTIVRCHIFLRATNSTPVVDLTVEEEWESCTESLYAKKSTRREGSLSLTLCAHGERVPAQPQRASPLPLLLLLLLRNLKPVFYLKNGGGGGGRGKADLLSVEKECLEWARERERERRDGGGVY